MLKRILLLTNTYFEPYWRAYIKDRFSCFSVDIQIDLVVYEEYRYYNESIRVSDIIIVCLSFEEFYPNLKNDILLGTNTYAIVEEDCIRKCRELYSYIKNICNAKLIWLGFEDYYYPHSNNYGTLLSFEGLVDQLNLVLNDMLKEDIFIDFKRLIASVGIKNAYDTKGKYRWNAPYSKELIGLMVNEIYKQYLIATGNTKKCLVIDCDNVLWGGILSEDGIEGINISGSGLGRPFQDFQRYLLDLYYHGVIIAVCSKNDESDVLRVFREHTGMLLKEEHIACFTCNWDNKPDNIKDISERLNIGLDSIVFVDDSIFEIESVKAMLPEVTTVLYQRDTVYDKLSCFNLKRSTDLKTVSERTISYKTNTLRSELKKNASSYENYISSLEMIVDIHKTMECELARVSELTQRANRCTNGIRYTVNELVNKMQNPNYNLWSITVSDRFADLGIVGAIGIYKNTLDLFVLSCRTLGRGIEVRMMSLVNDQNVEFFSFSSTKKNGAIYDMFIEEYYLQNNEQTQYSNL